MAENYRIEYLCSLSVEVVQASLSLSQLGQWVFRGYDGSELSVTDFVIRPLLSGYRAMVIFFEVDEIKPLSVIALP